MKVVIVTGCSSGIGLALARRLRADENFICIATAREKSLGRLKEAGLDEHDRFVIRTLDITDDSQILKLVNETLARFRRIDAVVNNAGISYRSVIEHMDEESELHQLKTNYLGPLSLIRAVIPAMREQGSGHIINVSSVSGMVAMPTMGSYSASKGALEGASEALWYELRPFGVKVSIVQPGFVHSESFKNVYFSKKAKISSALAGPYADYYASMSPFIEKLMNFSNVTPEKIAGRITRLLEMKRPPLWSPVTLDAFVFNILRRLLPHSIFYALMFKMLPNSKQWSKRLLSQTRRPLAQWPPR